MLDIGDYVLATKYNDGDPQDHWVVGFFAGIISKKYSCPHYDIIDGYGNLFRGNGFRRVEKISFNRGKWVLDNKEMIEHSENSVWYFKDCDIC